MKIKVWKKLMCKMTKKCPMSTTAIGLFLFLFLLQKGSVELTMDTEGGHYASKFVNIAKGSYEGQMVIGDSFIHPIKEFTVSEGSDIIVLHFKFNKGAVCYI